MFFPTPLPEVIFRETLRRSRPKSAIFDGFGIPAGVQTGPLERHFRPKRLPVCTSKSYPERPGTDLGTIWCRKRSKDSFLSIWGRFWLILEGFWKDFGPGLDDFSMTCQGLEHRKLKESTDQQSKIKQPCRYKIVQI